MNAASRDHRTDNAFVVRHAPPGIIVVAKDYVDELLSDSAICYWIRHWCVRCTEHIALSLNHLRKQRKGAITNSALDIRRGSG